MDMIAEIEELKEKTAKLTAEVATLHARVTALESGHPVDLTFPHPNPNGVYGGKLQ